MIAIFAAEETGDTNIDSNLNLYEIKLPPNICQWLQSQFNEDWQKPGFTLPEKYRYLVLSFDMLQLCTTNKQEAEKLAKRLAKGKLYDRKEKRYLFIG